MYAEAASLYAHSQKVYEEQLGLSRLGKTGLAQGYGVASLPLVEETLRSCESGMRIQYYVFVASQVAVVDGC